MKIFWKLLQILLAVFMIIGGIQHFLKPDFYIPFVVDFLPFKTTIIYISGLIAILLGVLLCIPPYAKIGAKGILLLMLLYLPIHIWDVFTETPAIGSHTGALIRLPVQFLFIAWAWKINRFVNIK